MTRPSAQATGVSASDEGLGLRLASVADYNEQLSERTQLPKEQLDDLLGWSERDIRREARAVTRVLKRFAQAVVEGLGAPEEMDDFLAELDLRLISRDHDWRAIFGAIRDFHGEHDDELKRTTLVKYLQYLSFRKRLLDYIWARKSALADTGEMATGRVDTRPPTPDGLSQDAAGLARMPIGESISVELDAQEVLELLLGRNLFELVGGERPYLVDENGVTCFVRVGRNVVGRHPECDVSVDANFSNVSRAHLVLEWDGERRFTLMDLSSRGSYLRESVLRAALKSLPGMSS